MKRTKSKPNPTTAPKPGRRQRWKFGDRRRLALAAQVNEQQLSDVLHARKRFLPEPALRVVEQARILGYEIELTDLLFPFRSTNPLLYRSKANSKAR